MNTLGVNLVEYNRMSTPPSIEDRRLAEFSEEEIVEMLKQDGFGAIVPKPRVPGPGG